MVRKKDDGPWPEHPLFPAEDDEEPVRVEFIQVVRHDNGRPKIVPQAFRAAELQSLAQIHSMWGGGLYELIARRSSIHDPTQMGRLSGSRVRYEIPGASRPLSESPDDVPVVQPGTGIGATPAIGVPPVDNSVMGMFMQMQMQMFQVSQENARQQAEQQRRADERSRTDTQQMMQMMASMQASSNQSMMGVVTALITRDSGGGAGGVDQIAKTAELFKSLGVLGPKVEEGETAESIGSIISNVADIVSGAVELKGGLPGAPVAPGSAASALGMPPTTSKISGNT